MKKASQTLLACVIGGLLAGCRTGGEPLILYEGAVRPLGEVSIIRIVRTHPRWGHPTLNVRRVTRLDPPAHVAFEASEAAGWQIPSHFAGPPDNSRQSRQGNPRDYPDEFRVLPGTYQIDFLHVPAVDRWGWTHVPPGMSTHRLTCVGGVTYFLEGELLEDGDAWLLHTSEEKTRDAGVGASGE